MHGLTDRQRQVYAFIAAYRERRGYAPTLQEIAAHLGVSGNVGVLRHLAALERKGYLRRQPGNPRSITLLGERASTAVSLPLLGTVRAGGPAIPLEEPEGFFAVDRSLVKGGESFLLRVRGDSMLGAHILPGDLAVVRPQTTAENGAIVVALVEGEATLKRFYREGGKIRLQPENPELAPLIVDPDDRQVAIVGLVTGICRPFL